MRSIFNLKPEPSLKCWVLRALIGPAWILEGVIATCTLCTVVPGIPMRVATKLMKARWACIKHIM